MRVRGRRRNDVARPASERRWRPRARDGVSSPALMTRAPVPPRAQDAGSARPAQQPDSRRAAVARGRGGGAPAPGRRRDGLPRRPGRGRLQFAVDAGIRNPEARQLIRDLSLPVGVGLFGHAIASGRGGRLGRLPAGQALPPLGRRRQDRDDRQHALDGRGAAHRRRRGARRARRLLVADRRLRRGGGGAAARAGRPRGGGDRQPAAHRAAGALAGGAGAPRRGAAHARRDQRPDRGDPRARARSSSRWWTPRGGSSAPTART